MTLMHATCQLSQQLKVCDRILTHADQRRTCILHTERLQPNGGIKRFILLFFIEKFMNKTSIYQKCFMRKLLSNN